MSNNTLNVDLLNKLSNMCYSEISEEVYDLINENDILFKRVEKEVKRLIPYYGITGSDELYDNDAIYMEAIINVLGNKVTNVKCGWGTIELKTI